MKIKPEKLKRKRMSTKFDKMPHYPLKQFRRYQWTMSENTHAQPEHTRSSATAEKQRVSCACLPRLDN